MQTHHSNIRLAAITAALVFGTGVFLPSPASAGLYKYERDDGSILLTNAPRHDLKLVEVVSGPPPSAQNSDDSADDAESSDHDDRDETDREHSPRASNSSTSSEVGPLRRNRFDDLIGEASEAYNVPFAFIKAVIRVESDFSPDAVSHAGAMGLMQLMPATADQLNVRDPFNPRQNIFGGTKFLRKLIDRYDGDINLILSAYNAGGGAVAEYDGIPYRQTRRYVASVYRWYKHYSGQTDGGDE